MMRYEREALRVEIMRLVAQSGVTGMTAKEAREVILTDHHGAISGAMCKLHKEGQLSRLSDKRHHYMVYVLPEFVNGRKTAPYPTKSCWNCGVKV